MPNLMHERCAGLDVHKKTVVAAVRLVEGAKVTTEVKTFATSTAGLVELGEWLTACEVSLAGMESTGVYWRPVWHVLSACGLELTLANAMHVKNLPGRKTDVGDASQQSARGAT